MDDPLPIACSLPLDEGADRRVRWERLAARGNAVLERTSAGIRLALRPEPGVEDELRELADLERDCCSFARWNVRDAGDRLVLEVEADGDGAAAVQAMFRA
jgi:hypothetical protein